MQKILCCSLELQGIMPNSQTPQCAISSLHPYSKFVPSHAPQLRSSDALRFGWLLSLLTRSHQLHFQCKNTVLRLFLVFPLQRRVDRCSANRAAFLRVACIEGLVEAFRAEEMALIIPVSRGKKREEGGKCTYHNA